jgi:hypothetical protein
MSRVFININELCTVNESFHSAFDKIKPMITDKYLQIEPKFGEHITIQNCANFLCTTNHRFTMKLEGNVCRYACFSCSSRRLGDEGYFERLAACMTDDHANHFFTYITSMFQDTVPLRKIPETGLRLSMMDSSKTSSVRFIESLRNFPETVVGSNDEVVFYTLPGHKDLVTKDHLYDCFKQWALRNGEKVVTNNVFCRRIQRFVNEERPRSQGRRVQCVRCCLSL